VGSLGFVLPGFFARREWEVYDIRGLEGWSRLESLGSFRNFVNLVGRAFMPAACFQQACSSINMSRPEGGCRLNMFCIMTSAT
jgi:hypothetical protein